MPLSSEGLTNMVRTIVDKLVGLYGRARREWPLTHTYYQRFRDSGTSVEEVLGRTHRRAATEVRWAAWLYLYDVRGWAVTAIARAWGRTGHAAITEGIQAARKRVDLTALVAAI